jgi:uncharacterized protein (DUF885 family)
MQCAALSLVLFGSALGATPSREDARLAALVQAAQAEDRAADPTAATSQTMSGSLSTWTPVTDAYKALTEQRLKARLAALARAIHPARLSADGKIQYDLYRATIELQVLRLETQRKAYFQFGNVFDPATDLPDVLLNAHTIKNAVEAQAYLARLEALPDVLRTVLEEGHERQARGVVMMRVEYPALAARVKELYTGAPCEGEGEHPLLANFSKKLASGSIGVTEREALLAKAKSTLASKVCPAYAAFAKDVASMEASGRTQGVWSMPDGEAVYRDVLQLNLTERVDPERLHAIGLSETKRLQEAVKVLMAKVGFTGTLAEFNTFLRTSDEVSLPNTPEGRKQYVELARTYEARIQAKLPLFFADLPKDPIVIEEEKHGPTGGPPTAYSFYTEAPMDGSRPAVYNLGMPRTPRLQTWSMGTTTYHETVPGHHLQTSLARQYLHGQYDFRNPFYPAYFDGWALYAEELGGEMGGYDNDDYARIGWLEAQLTRTVRIVVDTGLNFKHWTPEQAIAYETQNAAEVEGVNRFLRWPGQGIAYYWGYLRFKELRDKAQKELGPRFDIKEFHRVVLDSGQVPLNVLEEKVDAWIAATRQR